MDKKYKFDLEEKLDEQQRKRFLDLFKDVDRTIEPIDLHGYEVDRARTAEFLSCVVALETIFAGKNVNVNYEFYGLVGKIDIVGKEIGIHGDDMGAFAKAVRIAKTIEIDPCVKGKAQISLTVTGLKKKIRTGGVA